MQGNAKERGGQQSYTHIREDHPQLMKVKEKGKREEEKQKGRDGFAGGGQENEKDQEDVLGDQKGRKPVHRFMENRKGLVKGIGADVEEKQEYQVVLERGCPEKPH